MKRRNFLQGMIATPAIAKAVDFEKIQEWQPTLYEFGNFGIMEIQVITENPKEYQAVTYCPQNDWINECQIISRCEFGSYRATHFSALGRPFHISVPVNELTKVEVYEDDVLIHTQIAKHDHDYIFEPFVVND